jgi:hypothetical protein
MNEYFYRVKVYLQGNKDEEYGIIKAKNGNEAIRLIKKEFGVGLDIFLNKIPPRVVGK